MKQTRYIDGAIITALGHDGFIVEYPEQKFSLAFDPYDIKEPILVDYIFVSHPHFDHCDIHSIRKMLKPKTKVIAPSSCQEMLKDLPAEHIELVSDKEKHVTKHFTYWTIPAYNIDKFRTPSEVFHPKGLGGVGFVVEVGKTRYFHAGDTDFTPEMAELKKIDVAFLPISGTFVMTLEEALRAAQTLEPDLTIPMHFGKLLGSVAEAQRFQNLLRDQLKVVVLSTDGL